MKRAEHLGWPNTYTFTKSLGESLLAQRGRNLAIAIVRPSIVESSQRTPFTGWNEGINTSGPLSYLLGITFDFKLAGIFVAAAIYIAALSVIMAIKFKTGSWKHIQI